MVEETLERGGGGLKEVVIGNAVYERDPPYDSRIDSTVRVEARRLRRKLRDYYLRSGGRDPVLIDLPTGGYVPTFSTRSAHSPSPTAREIGEAVFCKGDGAAVAVMPFRAISLDREIEMFAEGLTDELIFSLGKVAGLWVASRSSVYQFRGQDRSPAELARLLDVDAVLQGTVRHESGMMRVTIETSDVDGFVVWSDRFDVPDSQCIHLQEKIGKTLINRVRFDYSGLRDMKVGPGPMALRASADIYRARLLLDRQTPDSIAQARRIFEQVAAMAAPDFGRGHSGVADCCCDLFRLGVMERKQARELAVAGVQTALAIDPRSVEANTARATIAAWIDRNAEEAEAAFEHLRRLGANARANRLYGVFLSLFGEHERALRLFREARDMEPFSTQQDIAEAMSHYQSRRHELITSRADSSAAGLQPGEALVFIALAHVFGGTPDIAAGLIDEIEQQCRETPDYVFIGAEIEAWLGDRRRAAALVCSRTRRGTKFATATLAASLGNEAECLDALEAAIDREELSTVWMRSDQRFDAFRESERFRRLVDRLQPFGAAESGCSTT